MRTSRRVFVLIAAMTVAAPLILAARRDAGATTSSGVPSLEDWQAQTGPYRVVANWPQPLPDTRHSHNGWTWGSVGAVFAETPDRIWIAQRGELPLPAGAAPWTPYGALTPARTATGNGDGISATCGTAAVRGWERRWEHSIIIVDRAGKMVDEWPHLDQMFGQLPCGRGPHKIKINPHDPAKHVWIFDDQLHVIYKFSHDGKLVHTLGQLGVRGRGPNTFDRPTSIDWFPDGTYFISDGYGGTRVAKYDKDNKFIMDWGGPPANPASPGPNEFNTVHSIAVSKDRRVFVADRGHSRIQVFDENGKFLYMFTTNPPGHPTTGQQSQPYDHIITDDQFLWVVDGMLNRVVKYDLQGKELFSWGTRGGLPGQLNGGHQLTVDQEGNLYIAEVFGGRVQKFAPAPGADRAQLIGQEVRGR